MGRIGRMGKTGGDELLKMEAFSLIKLKYNCGKEKLLGCFTRLMACNLMINLIRFFEIAIAV
jgi:hypothetical protein